MRYNYRSYSPYYRPRPLTERERILGKYPWLPGWMYDADRAVQRGTQYLGSQLVKATKQYATQRLMGLAAGYALKRLK